MTMVQKFLLLAAAVAGGACLAGVIRPPHDANGAPEVLVRFDDLDFHHVPDAMVLFGRIDDASVQACGGTPGFLHARQAAAFERCRRATIERTVRRMNWAVLGQVAANQTMPPRIAVR